MIFLSSSFGVVNGSHKQSAIDRPFVYNNAVLLVTRIRHNRNLDLLSRRVLGGVCSLMQSTIGRDGYDSTRRRSYPFAGRNSKNKYPTPVSSLRSDTRFSATGWTPETEYDARIPNMVLGYLAVRISVIKVRQVVNL
jgi:hypothetical protein